MNIEIMAKIVIPIIGAIITFLIVPFLREKTTKEQRDNICFWVKVAVNAAEQLQDAGLISIPRKEYVLEFIRSKGFNITEKELDVLIEAAVKELNIVQNK